MMRPFVVSLVITFFSILCASHAELLRYHDEATDLYGFKDADGTIVIPPQFDSVLAPAEQKLFSPENKDTEHLVPVIKKGKIWQMTSSGTLKFQAVFFDNGADYYKDGLARFIEDYKVGFHDRAGNVAIKPLYDFATPFRDGYSIVCNGCHAEYPKNPKYLPISASFCQNPRNEEYKVVVGGKYGVINTKGEIVLPLNYKSLKDVDGALDKAIKNKKTK